MLRSTPIAALLGTILLAGCVGGLRFGTQQPPAAGAGVLDASVRTGQLANGLTYYIRHNAEPQRRAELRLVVNAGSVLEDPDQLGLAHVVEHMAFNGTRNFAHQELVEYLESVGMRFGPDINAYTSFDETVYMLTLPTDREGVVETGVQILEDWAQGIVFDTLEIEKERGVVIEEWRMGQGAGTRMRDRQFPILTQRSRYAERLPIGTYESLASYTPTSLRRFYRDWYRPDLMAVVAVGDFDVDVMEQLIRQHFEPLENPKRPRRRSDFEIPGHRRTLVSVATDPEAAGTSISLYLKRQPTEWRSVSAYRGWIVESLASSMLTNRLSEYTQRPSSPFLDVSSFHGRFIRPLAAFVLNVRVPDGGVANGLRALVAETERASRHGFTGSELEREKRDMMRMMEQRYAERDKTTSGSFASDYTSHFLYGGLLVNVDAEFELYGRFIPSITVEEVNRQAREWMRERNRVVLVTAPEGLDVPLPTERELRSTIASMRRAPLLPYADSLSTAALVPEPPTPAAIVSERHHPEVGVTEWELANGVRLVMKPTDFRDDEVLFAGYSPGGTSQLSDEDYIAGLTAAAIVQSGGLGYLSAIDLRKRLAGTVAGVGADIGELHEGLSGAASPRDLPLLFQLVYLKFMEPRVDSAAFIAYQSMARSTLANRSASPENAFMDSVRVTMAQHHPRALPPSATIFDHLDMHRSLEIYRERFADASDFTFFMVGNFDPEAIRPLAQRYLGSLPSLGREERGRDLGIRPPRGVVVKEVRKGMEPKAITQIVFTGEMEFNRENLVTLNALGDILRIRLREVLREDLGGTYGVEVRAGGSRDPHPLYRIAIGFGADPERIEELVRVTFATIDSLKAAGPRDGNLARVQEMQLRARELDLRRNHFWMTLLMSYDRHGWDWAEIPQSAERSQSLNPEQIRAAAVRYLDTQNYVRVTLLPEAPVQDTGTQQGREAGHVDGATSLR